MASGSSLDDGLVSVERAEKAVSSAFDIVSEAEVAGGNVSSLILRLNDAVGLLSEARVRLADGGSGDSVAGFAGQCIEIANSVRYEASTLRASALSQRDFVFKLSVVGSVVAVSFFLCFMFLFWRWFEGYYSRRVLGLRPEVVVDES